MAYKGKRINPQKFERGQIKIIAILLPLVIFMALPIVFIANHAFKPMDELFAFPPTFFVKNATLENFTTYAKKYFDSPLLSMTYDNIERVGNEKTGNMYVVWTTISNMFMRKLKDGEKIAQTNFVIIEKNYNDYEMSFSVNDQ